MNTCENLAALLDLYVDGELDAADMLRVQEHLANCSACQAYVDDALAIRAAFPDAEQTPVPEDFADSVMAAIRADTAAKKKPAPWVKLLLPLAACCAIVLLQQRVMPSFEASGTLSTTTTTECAAEETVNEATVQTSTAAGYSLSDSAFEAEISKGASTEMPTAAAEPQEAKSTAEAAPEEDGAYIMELYLAPEHADALSDYAPVAETGTALRYELTVAEYETLLAQLDGADAPPEAIGDSSGTVLVVLAKP